MKDFKKYLISKNIIQKKRIHYYLNWVTQLYVFCQAEIGAAVNPEKINQCLKELSNNLED